MPTYRLGDYLSGFAVTRATGATTDETAFYSVLMGLKNQGAGMPDVGRGPPLC